MKHVLHKKLCKILVGLLFMGNISSCYDGWDESVASENGPHIPVDPDAPKPLYLVLFEYFSLSTDATADSSCFGATGTELFRTTEWSQRVDAATEALGTVAETVSVVRRSVNASDCSALTTVELASLDADPSGVTSIADDPLGRPMVHLKAVFWDTDVSGSFTGLVTTPHWSAWRVLRTRGRPATSLHYFSLSNATTGRFTNWRSALDSDIVKNATAIDSVDPTEAGSQNRLATAAADSKELANWTVQKAIEAFPNE